MQAAASRSARVSKLPRPDRFDAFPLPQAADDCALLNALPIAAAIFTSVDGKLWVDGMNERFQTLAQCDGAHERFAETFKRYAASPGGAFVKAFLSDPRKAPNEIEFVDGEGVSARYFRMKAALLPGQSSRSVRCLLSVVDRTVEVQAERTLRAEMLRDSLTGLPNRLAFSEAIEQAGSTVARDLEHAVLVVDMLRFSRINESMGSLAGDELLITFARRLILALRAGDVLSRTGGNEFGVLVSLRRGVEDALKAAERIQHVMATPFKLSELEIRVECAIGVSLMHGEQDPEELFRNAQFAVKQAKKAGGPQVYEANQATE